MLSIIILIESIKDKIRIGLEEKFPRSPAGIFYGLKVAGQKLKAQIRKRKVNAALIPHFSFIFHPCFILPHPIDLL
jgi:hypothetical protein